jgi:hypothetical protein
VVVSLEIHFRTVYRCLHPMRYTRAEISPSRFGRPLYLELDLLFVFPAFVLDIADGANRDRYPLARNLDLEALSVLQGVGKPPAAASRRTPAAGSPSRRLFQAFGSSFPR